MTIGLICAIPQELAHLRERARGTRQRSWRAVRQFDSGRLDGHEVVLVGAGIGKVNTALVATLLADRFGCRLIVFSGVAGGLDPALAHRRRGDRRPHAAARCRGDRGRAARHLSGRATCRSSTRPTGWATRSTPALVARLRARLDGFALPPLSRAAGGAGAAAADRVRHDPVGRPVHSLRGDARAAVPRAGRGWRWRWRAGPWARSPRRSASRFSTSARCPTSPARIRGSTSPPSSHEVAGSSALILRHLLPVL